MTATTERRAWILGTTAPALVFLLVIAYLPIAYAVMLSFFKKTAFNPAMKWVGLANYRYILGGARALERLLALRRLHAGRGRPPARLGPGLRAPPEPRLPRPQLRAQPVRPAVPAAVHRGRADLPVAALAGVRRRQPGADADRRGRAPDQLLRRPGHRDVGGHRHGGLAVRLLRHAADPGPAAGHQPQALRGRRRLGRRHAPRLPGT